MALSRFAKVALLCAFFARLALIAIQYPKNPSSVLLFDSGSYLRPAQALRLGGRFSISPSRLSEPEIVRTPGYPAMIAAVFRIAGDHVWLLAVLNAVFAAGAGVLLFRLTADLAGVSAANCAVFLSCAEPSTFHYGTVVMTEAPFTFCLALALWFLDRVRTRHALAPALCSGALLGAATLVRPVLVFAILPVVVILGVAVFQSGSGTRKALLLSVVIGGAALGVIGPWMARNGRLTGDSSLSQIKNVNLYFFDAAAVVATVNHESVQAVQERFGVREFAYRFGFVATEAEAFGPRRCADLFPASCGLPLIELAHSYRDRAYAILAGHPWTELLVRLRGLALLLGSPPTIAWADHSGWFRPDAEFNARWLFPRPASAVAYLWRTNRWLALASLASLVPVFSIYLFAWSGMRSTAGGLRGLYVFLAVYLALASTVPGSADDRFRVPMLYVLFLFAGAGMARTAAARR